MIQFQVHGPIAVPLYKKALAPDVLRREFWGDNAKFAEKSGCYVFAAPAPRRPGVFLPIYAGKAERTFKQEVFAPEKLTKLNRYLQDHPTQDLKVFFLVRLPHRGRQSAPAIRELEEWLIKLAVSMNKNLINKKGTKPENWGVRGIVRGGRGVRSKDASALRGVLGLDDGEVETPKTRLGRKGSSGLEDSKSVDSE